MSKPVPNSNIITTAPVTMRPRGCPEGIVPQRWREALTTRIEHHQLAVERLIAALDTMDADPDLEPSLAAPEIHLGAHGAILPCRDDDGAQVVWSAGGLLSLEDEADADDQDSNPVTLNPARRSPAAYRTRRPLA